MCIRDRAWSLRALGRAADACEKTRDAIETYQDFGHVLLGGTCGRYVVAGFVVGFQFGILSIKFLAIGLCLEALLPTVSRNGWICVSCGCVSVMTCVELHLFTVSRRGSGPPQVACSLESSAASNSEVVSTDFWTTQRSIISRASLRSSIIE